MGILSLIVANVAATVLESVEAVRVAWGPELLAFEVFSVAVFTVEYLTRLWACTVDKRYRRPVAGRLRWATTPLALVDLVAILPAFLPMVGVDLRFVRALRLMRLARLAKVARYTAALDLISRVFRAKREELVMTVGMTGILLVVAASLMYHVEHPAQPEAFSSIPKTMWWAVATLTTVGYGDVYPVTLGGRVLGSIVAFLGIGLFALPTGILGSGFMDEMERRREGRVCPHCGREL